MPLDAGAKAFTPAPAPPTDASVSPPSVHQQQLEQQMAYEHMAMQHAQQQQQQQHFLQMQMQQQQQMQMQMQQQYQMQMQQQPQFEQQQQPPQQQTDETQEVSMTEVDVLERVRQFKSSCGQAYSIDVECIACGTAGRDRAVARVVLVNAQEELILDRLVKPDVEIVSYLTQLTGIKEGALDSAPSLAQVREELVRVLPKDALLVGQAIHKDIEWLDLQAGEHYAAHFDVGELFRLWSPRGKRYRMFSLRHQVLHLRGFKGAGTDMQSGAHDPVKDAAYALRLFAHFGSANPGALRRARLMLGRAPRTLPFWRTCPVIDGVEMGPPGSSSSTTKASDQAADQAAPKAADA